MNLAPFQQRVVDEKTDLDAKHDSLDSFIKAGTTFLTLDGAEQTRLVEQRFHMSKYSEVLGRRIAAFVELAPPPKP